MVRTMNPEEQKQVQFQTRWYLFQFILGIVSSIFGLIWMMTNILGVIFLIMGMILAMSSKLWVVESK
jgi:hypothetical protein